MIPDKLGTTAAGLYGCAVSINVISSRAICIVEVCSEKQDPNQIKLSLRIVDCLRNFIHVSGIAVIDKFETDRPCISLLGDSSLNCLDPIILRKQWSHEEGPFIADNARSRIINDE
jgi:hypothetical protein